MNSPPKTNEKQVAEGRRGFLKKALVTASSVAGFLAVVTFDSKAGVKIGNATASLDMSAAQGQCGSAVDCSGGGGKCGSSVNCSGS